MQLCVSPLHDAKALLFIIMMLVLGVAASPSVGQIMVVGSIGRVCPGSLQGMSANGRFLLVNGQRLTIVDGAIADTRSVELGNWKLDNLSVFAMSRNGRYLFFTANRVGNPGHSNIYRYDCETRHIKGVTTNDHVGAVYSTQFYTYRNWISNDGNIVIFRTAAYNTYCVDLSAEVITAHPFLDGEDGFCLSGDGLVVRSSRVVGDAVLNMFSFYRKYTLATKIYTEEGQKSTSHPTRARYIPRITNEDGEYFLLDNHLFDNYPNPYIEGSVLYYRAQQVYDAPFGANGHNAQMSGDARYFTYVEDGKIYRRDRLAPGGARALISIGYPTGVPNGNSSGPQISDDGKIIAFTSAASNLVPYDANGSGSDVFIFYYSPKAIAGYNCVCPYNDCTFCGGWNPSSGGMNAVNPRRRYGPQAGDPVNLATGREAYTPPADLSVYNPTGTRAAFQRAYFSARAQNGACSPGLSVGWVHNFDVYLRTEQEGAGALPSLALVYPKGAEDPLQPLYNGNGVATGAFQRLAGAPYLVSGVPGATDGVWQSVTVTWNDHTQWQFTPAAGVYALTRITNQMGKYVDVHWDAQRRLQAVINDRGTTLLSCAYGGNGLLATISDAYGRKIVYTYTTPTGIASPCLHTVSQIADVTTPNPPMRYTFGYLPDAQATPRPLLHTITVPSPAGTGTSTSTINYDLATGKVASLVDGNGNQQVFTYALYSTKVEVKDSQGTLVKTWTQKHFARKDIGIENSNGKASLKDFADPANPMKVTRVVEPDGRATSYQYDKVGNLIAKTSPRGVVTRYMYSYTTSPFGRLLRVQEGTKTPTTYTYYEPSGLPKTVTQARPGSTTGAVVTTRFTYDELGNILTIAAPGNSVAGVKKIVCNYTTDGSYQQTAALGQPLTIADGAGRVWRMRYHADGTVASVKSSAGQSVTFAYNRAGQTTHSVTYDAAQPVAGIIQKLTNTYLYPDGPLVSERVYDGQDVLKRQVQYAYDLEGELLARTGDTEAVTYAYDAAYRVTSLTDGRNQTTSYTYDDYTGQVATVTDPGGIVVQRLQYDPYGNVTGQVDGNGVSTYFAYADPEGLLTDIYFPSSPASSIHYAYDEYGRRTAMMDAVGTTSYTYDDRGYPLSVSTTYAEMLPSQPKTISYTYYPDGQRATMTVPVQGGGLGTFIYKYHADGQLASLTNPFGKTTVWHYDAQGRVQKQVLGNRAWTTYAYDAAGRYARLVNFDPKGRVLSDFRDLVYSALGDCTQLRAVVPGLPAFSGLTSYAYDSKGQLVQEVSERLGGYTDAYAYDAAGNPTTVRDAQMPPYTATNQPAGEGYAYDGNGNPTLYGGATLAYDPMNHLTAYRAPGEVVLMTAGYTGDGLRAWKEGLGGRTYYLYDGTQLVCELTDTGAVSAVMTWGALGLLARNDTWYQCDVLGNVAHRLDGTGVVQSSHQYDAYGKGLVPGAASDPYGYKGQYGYYTDHLIGLILCTWRYYDPLAGRWLTRDPIGYIGGVNLYQYSGNNATTLSDALGLRSPVAPIVPARPVRPAIPPAEGPGRFGEPNNFNSGPKSNSNCPKPLAHPDTPQVTPPPMYPDPEYDPGSYHLIWWENMWRVIFKKKEEKNENNRIVFIPFIERESYWLPKRYRKSCEDISGVDDNDNNPIGVLCLGHETATYSDGSFHRPWDEMKRFVDMYHPGRYVGYQYGTTNYGEMFEELKNAPKIAFNLGGANISALDQMDTKTGIEWGLIKQDPALRAKTYLYNLPILQRPLLEFYDYKLMCTETSYLWRMPRLYDPPIPLP